VEGAIGRVQLFGSGTILREAMRAQKLLAEKFNVASDVWSVTSYCLLAREAADVERWNRLHPAESPRQSYLEHQLADVEGPIISTSDNVRLVADQIRQWVRQDYTVLGTDGFGRSDTRSALRRHFEVDAENAAYAALHSLAKAGSYDSKDLVKALETLGLDPEQINPLYA
jgi:pyruvate dehydrogenase E1 component